MPTPRIPGPKMVNASKLGLGRGMVRIPPPLPFSNADEAHSAAVEREVIAKRSGATARSKSSIEALLDAADVHGSESDYECQVGDLEQIARSLWAHMTPEQQKAAAASAEMVELLEEWGS